MVLSLPIYIFFVTCCLTLEHATNKPRKKPRSLIKGKYCPAFIEWIDDESCNVVWNDKVSATRALHFVSRPIQGMPVEGACNPFEREVVMETPAAAEEGNKNGESEIGQSILLKNVNREVEMEKNDEATSPAAAVNAGEDKENNEGK